MLLKNSTEVIFNLLKIVQVCPTYAVVAVVAIRKATEIEKVLIEDACCLWSILKQVYWLLTINLLTVILFGYLNAILNISYS